MTRSFELFGRDPELARLSAVLDAIDDEGTSVVLRGQPGVGKSSVLRVAAVMAQRRGASVLRTSGIESAAMGPFAGLHELLHPLEFRLAALPEVQRMALLTAFGTIQGPPPELFLTALAALTLIVDAAARRPVVLLVDDVQWLDAATVDVLAFVSRRLRQDPVVMISALRDGYEVPLTGVESADSYLHGLDPASSRALLSTVAPDLADDDTMALLDQARGNPLALVELPAVWRPGSGAPVTAEAVHLTLRLERAFAARITELPSTARDALLIAAVEAQENMAEILAATAVLAGVRITTEHLEPAARARLVDFDESHVRFRHPLVRSGVLHAETPARRRLAHAALSDVLVMEPYRAVWHRAQAVEGTDDHVAARLEASHGESMRRGSVLNAIADLELSAQLTSDSALRGRRLLLAARLGWGLGRVDLVGRLVDAAEANELGAIDRARAEWLRELFGEGTLGDSPRIRELCSLAVRSAGFGDVDLSLDLLSSAALRCWWSAQGQRDRDEVVEAAGALPNVSGDPRYISVVTMADPLGQAGRTRELLDDRAAAGVADIEQLRHLGMAARAAGAEPMAADYYAAVETKLRERGQLGLLSQVLAVQAAVYLDLGSWRRAGQNLEEARTLSVETGQAKWGTGAAAVEVVYEALTGRTDEAFAHADEIEAACADQVAGDFRSLVQLARGAAHLSLGRPADALTALLPIFEPDGPCHHPREQLSSVMFLAEAAVGCDAVDRVSDLVRRLEVLATTSGSEILTVHLLYARAVLAPDDAAEKLYLDALDQDLTRWPWPRARIELSYGNWLRRGRRMTDARVTLRSALTTLEAVGAPAWSHQARLALRSAGDRDSAATPAAPGEAMTAQEMQIARLAADGLSNREIGQQLYLSPRTVGSHLYRIFPKLGVTSRTQLASRMSDF